MDPTALSSAYEVMRDEIVEANQKEVANRLKEAGFDPQFASGLFPLRAGSSVKSSAAPSVDFRRRRRRRSDSVESDFKPRRSLRAKKGGTYSKGAEQSQARACDRFSAVSPCRDNSAYD